ncbi:hypothetical protein L596_026040 [Steinernema carpocapsae]|uniref:cyclin-dependent kinase n=1 Tax=Steinernema carpocapsae TaxID=34508 RepID=A0A4U5M066_STECR|nr:hypothetical protein L596_026040 [Steinernema carpocapsae]
MDKYLKLERIGEGVYGVVFKGHVRGDKKQMVALKQIRTDSDNEGVPSTALREIAILKELSHPNIVTLKDVFIGISPSNFGLFSCLGDEDQLHLVFEYISMDLREFLSKVFRVRRTVEIPMVKSFTQQILKGLSYLHVRRMFHRDLKPQNLLVHNGLIKLADFGLASETDRSILRTVELQSVERPEATFSQKQAENRGNSDCGLTILLARISHPEPFRNPGFVRHTPSTSLDSTQNRIQVRIQVPTKNGGGKVNNGASERAFATPIRPYTTEVVTLWYRPPEVLLGAHYYTTAVDIWSLACIIVEMIRGEAILKGDSEIDQLFRIFQLFGTPTDEEWKGISELQHYNTLFPKWPTKTIADVLGIRGDQFSDVHVRHEPIEQRYREGPP